MSWGGNSTNNAIKGLLSLLGRPEWQGTPELTAARGALRSQLESEDVEARMLTSNAIVQMFDPDEQVQQLTERLRHETEPRIQEALLGALGQLASLDPVAADSVLEHLDGEGTVASINFRPDDHLEDLTRAEGQLGWTLLDLFTFLVIWKCTPHASAAWAEWMEHPVEAPATVRTLIQRSRDAMKAWGSDGQARAFSWARDLTERVLAIVNDPGSADAPDTRQTSRDDPAMYVAHAIAVELYFASGAFTTNIPPEVERDRRPDPSFVDRAMPVLERLATVSDVATAYEVIRTLVFVARSLSGPALLAITTAVLDTPGFEQEQQGEAAIFELFDGLLANDPGGLLDQDEYLNRIRLVLERYVDVGSTAAIDQLLRLSQSFR